MPRVPRRLLGEGVYHVINRGHNRARVFDVIEGKEVFLGFLREYRRKFPIRILHWVIMGNHFHLAVEALKVRDLSAFMAGLQRKYTAFHHRGSRDRGEDSCGYLWQGRFKSPLVERESYLLACGRYIERNPVRAGLAEKPWDYPWSSSRAYVFGESDGLTDEDFNGPYLSLGINAEERRSEWRSYLSDPGADDEEALFRGGKNPVGRKVFIERILVREGRMTTAHPGVPKTHAEGWTDPNTHQE